MQLLKRNMEILLNHSIIGIANSQSDSTDTEIEMFSGGVEVDQELYQLM